MNKAQFGDAIVKLIAATPSSLEDIPRIQAVIKASVGEISGDPREETEANSLMLERIVCALLDIVEQRFGTSHVELYTKPEFINKRGSSVRVTVETPRRFGIAIGTLARGWAQVFYEICHETVHLLNPVLDIKTTPVAALEEGIAVKFAEEMYARYITVYTGRRPSMTPLQEPGNPWLKAFLIASKIPDEKLLLARETFGRFSTVNDPQLLMSIVNDCISPQEAHEICESFPYPENRIASVFPQS